ncbi:DUF255 domain-containing protein [bacterium]|nr:DUF255 domain-containing protein [bacterium]
MVRMESTMTNIQFRKTILINYFSAIVISLAGATAFAQDLEWRTDYAQARQESSQKNLPILIDFYTDNCFWCKQMDQRTFRDPALNQALAENWIPLRVNGKKESTLADVLKIRSYPTLVFASPDGKILGFTEGFIEAPALTALLEQHRDDSTTPNWMNIEYKEATNAIASSDYPRAVSILKKITEGCFVPICAGGGLKQISEVDALLRSGADKVMVNTGLFENIDFIRQIADSYGEQCIVASFDVKKNVSNQYELWSSNGMKLEGLAKDYFDRLDNFPVGEIYINSIDQDGTGNGYDLDILNILPSGMNKPVIFAGGVGNSKHLAAGLSESRIDAVATAHLFNFIGDGLKKARSDLIEKGYDLPIWDRDVAYKLSGNNLEVDFDK